MDTKALRQKILDLAIRGKLVPQDPNDEPASVLLDRIRAEKQQMVKDGKLKAKDLKNDTVIFVGDDNLHYEKFSDGSIKCIESEIPFDIPNGWEWSRLSTICYKLTDGTHHSPNNFPSGDFKYITAKNIKESGIDLTEITYVEAKVHKEIFARCNPEYGDVLYIKDGATSGIATVNNLNEAFSLLSSVALLKPAKGIDSWYMCNAMQSSYFYNTTREDMKGVGITRITLSMLSSRLIPIPPSIEQNRIAQKFRSLICIINGVETDKELLKEAIRLLKNKILDLAIRGKLVSQNPNDESASVLLERIHQEKEELIKAGKLKRDKRESIIFRGDDNSYYETTSNDTTNISISKKFPFEIPDNWAWTRFRNIIIDDKGGGTPDKSNTKYWGGNIPWMSVKDFSGAKNGVIMDTIDHVTQEGVNNSSTNIIDTSAIILCTRMGLGKYAKLAHPTAINQDLRAIWLSSHICENYFLSFYKTLNIDGNGTTVEGIKRDELMGNMIPIPPKSEQKRIADKVLQLFSTLDSIIHDC